MRNRLNVRNSFIHLASFVGAVIVILAVLHLIQPPRAVSTAMIIVGTLGAAAGLVWSRWRGSAT
jgi:hypothetical protein